ISRASLKIASMLAMFGAMANLPDRYTDFLALHKSVRKTDSDWLIGSEKKSVAWRWLATLDLAEQPCTREGPPALRGCRRDRQGLGRRFDGQAGEEAEFDQLGLLGILGGQPGQRFIQGEQLLRRGLVGEIEPFEADAHSFAGVLDRPLPPGVLDQDPAHGRGGRAEKMAATVPAERRGTSPHQPHVRLVNQRGRLERLPGLLLGQLLSGQLAQLVVDQGQELLGRPGVALLDS